MEINTRARAPLKPQTTVQLAWALLRQDLRTNKRYLLFTILFMMFIGIGLSNFLQRLNSDTLMDNYIQEPFFVMCIMLLGTYYNRASIYYYQDNSYVQQLFYWRTLPIPNLAILLYRVLGGLLSIPINSLLMLVPMCLLADYYSAKDSDLSVQTFLVLVLTLLGCCFIYISLTIRMEFTIEGKRMFYYINIGMVVCYFVFLLIQIMMQINFKIHILQWLWNFSAAWGWCSPLLWGSLVLSILLSWLILYRTYKRMVLRDVA
jgi:hypothetical protein